jgi:cell division protein FtsB
MKSFFRLYHPQSKSVSTLLKRGSTALGSVAILIEALIGVIWVLNGTFWKNFSHFIVPLIVLIIGCIFLVITRKDVSLDKDSINQALSGANAAGEHLDSAGAKPQQEMQSLHKQSTPFKDKYEIAREDVNALRIANDALRNENASLKRENDLLKNQGKPLKTPVVDVPPIQAPPEVRPYTLRYPSVGCFTVPIYGNESDDASAIENNRCAVTDGAGRSFQSGHWAEIIATEFVDRDTNFVDEQDFVDWLLRCSKRWENWAKNEWLPNKNKNLPTWRNWEGRIREGAQTTLVGCSFVWKNSEEIEVTVFAVGDSNFFLFRQLPVEGWQCIAGYPHNTQDSIGGNITETLATASLSHIEYAFEAYKPPQIYTARPGDYIVLATDKLALWILKQRQSKRWKLLFGIKNDDDFNTFVTDERDAQRLELDDTTMLIIPIKPSSPKIDLESK